MVLTINSGALASAESKQSLSPSSKIDASIVNFLALWYKSLTGVDYTLDRVS